MAGSRWSGKSLGMGSSVFDSESDAAGSWPKFSGVSVKSTARLGVIIGACCWGKGTSDIAEGTAGNEGEWGTSLLCRSYGFWSSSFVWSLLVWSSPLDNHLWLYNSLYTLHDTRSGVVGCRQMLHQPGWVDFSNKVSVTWLTLVKVTSEINYVNHVQIRECRKSVHYEYGSSVGALVAKE